MRKGANRLAAARRGDGLIHIYYAPFDHATAMAPCRYRLSDVVRGWGRGANECACAFGTDRIGCRYLQGHYGLSNLTALAAIVSTHLSTRPWLVADNRFTYVHVRAGDGIVGPDCFNNVSDCRHLASDDSITYAKTREFFERFPLRKKWNMFVIVATTSHYHTDTDRTAASRYQQSYMSAVIQHFRSIGPTVVRVNSDPDDDFALLSTAKYLRITGGNYGRLARQLRRFTGR